MTSTGDVPSQDDLADTVIRPSSSGGDLGDALGDTIIRPVRVGTDRPPVTVGTAEPGVGDISARFRIVVNGGDPVPLDRTVIVGRRPRAGGGGQATRLVTVESPSREVSGNHLEVRVVGGSVVVTDLRSTNGTVIRMPGIRASTMSPGDSVVATLGSRVDVGDGNVIEIQAAPPLALPDRTLPDRILPERPTP
ncbi:MAG: FHA domain-containing protein [Burkholderiaceae bacterium]|nr:FHA domain-containing protein [Microbacteriaceae bacterium]